MTLGKKLKNCLLLAVGIPSLYTVHNWPQKNYIYIYIRILAVCFLSHLGCNIRFPIAHWLSPRGEQLCGGHRIWPPHSTVYSRGQIFSLFLCVFIHKKMYTCTHSYKSPQAKNTTFKRNLLPVLRVFDKNICPYDMRKICLQQLYTQYKVAVFPPI